MDWQYLIQIVIINVSMIWIYLSIRKLIRARPNNTKSTRPKGGTKSKGTKPRKKRKQVRTVEQHPWRLDFKKASHKKPSLPKEHAAPAAPANEKSVRVCNKVRYSTKAEAEDSLAKIRNDPNKRYRRRETRTYQCPMCKTWHLTSATTF